MIRIIRLYHGVPAIKADSSISPLICIIEFRELRDANGMYFTVAAIIASKKVSYSPNRDPKIKNAIPTAIDGKRYGKNAMSFT